MARSSRTTIAELVVHVWEPQEAPKARVLLCHGLWVGGWAWEPLATYLGRAGFASYAPTYRGHYDSRPAPDVGTLSMFDYVDDALTVCRAVEADAVVGHSGGGLVAQKVSEADPRLRAAAFLNSVPPRGILIRQSWRVMRAQLKYLGRLVGKQPVLPEEEDYLSLFVNAGPDAERAEFYRRICPDSGRALVDILLGRVAIDAGRVRCPVLVVAGGADPLFGPKLQRKIARKYGATYLEYPELGHHWFIQEGWEKAAADISGWLEKSLGGGG